MAITAKQLKIDIDAKDSDAAIRKLKDVDDATERVGQGASKISGLTSALGGVTGAATAVVGVLGTIAASAAAVGGAMFALAKQTSDAGSLIFDLSKQTGLSAETLSGLKFAADQTNVSIETMSDGVIKFERLIVAAARGSEEAEAKLKRLGIDPKKAIDDLEGSLQQAFQTIQSIEDPIRKAAAANDAFGKSGEKLLNVIDTANGNIPELVQKARELGLVFSTEDARAADEFGDTLTVLTAQAKGMGYTFAREWMPQVTSAMQGASDALKNNREQIELWGNAVSLGIDFAIRYYNAAIMIQQALNAFSVATAYSEVMKLNYALELVAGKTIGEGAFGNLAREGASGAAARVIAPSYDAMAGGGRGGGGAKQKSEREQAIEEMDRWLDKLNEEKLVLQSEQAALNQGTSVLENRKTTIKLMGEGYKLLTESEKQLLVESQTENDLMKARIDQQKILNNFFAEQATAQRAAIGNTNEFAVAYEELNKKIIATGFAFKQNADGTLQALNEEKDLRVREQIGLTAIYKLLSSQKSQLDEINKVTKSEVEKYNELVEKLNDANIPLDAALSKHARMNAYAIDLAKQWDKIMESANALLPQLPELPTDNGDWRDPNQIVPDDGTEPPMMKIDGWKTALTELKEIGLDAFGSLAQGFGSLVEAWVLYGTAGPNALRKMTASILASVASQSAVLAIFELAKGFAALFFNPAEAAAHFQAAALFGIAAGVAGAAGRLIAGDSFNQQGSGAQGAGGEAASGQATNSDYTRTVRQPSFVTTQINNAQEQNRLANVIERFVTAIEKFETASPGEILQKGVRQNPGLVAQTTVNELGIDQTLKQNFQRRLDFAV